MNEISLTSLILFALAFGSANSLFAIRHTASLPQGLRYLRPFFDGNDTIFTFGGEYSECVFVEPDTCQYWNRHVKDIFKFSISTGELEVMNAKLEKGQYYGSLLQDKEGMIYHLGGWLGNTERILEIYRFNPTTDELTSVGKLSHQYPFSPFAYKQKTNEAIHFYVFGEFGPTAMIQNLLTGEFRTVNVTGYDVLWSHAGVMVGNKFYIGTYEKFFVYDVLKETSEVLPVKFMTYNHRTVGSDSKGNIWGIVNISGSFSPNRVFRYNVHSGKMMEWKIDNYRDLPSFYGNPIYVEKHHRIYTFGGGNNKEVVKDIWYIDLEKNVE